MTLLTLNNKFKHTIIRAILENKFNVSLNEKERNEKNGFITKKLLLLRDTWEENTISDITAIVNDDQWHEVLDDEDTHVASFDVSPGRSRILFASKNMLRHFSYLHENQVHAGNETFKIVFNDHAFMFNGVIDKQQKFHLTSMMPCSRYEQSVRFWGIAAIKAEVCRRFNDVCTPKETMNYCSDGVFGAVTEGFPNSDNGQCCCRVIAKINKNHTKHFRNKANKNKIVEDLKSMQTIGFALHENPHPNETSFFIQFEKSSWEGCHKV